MKKIIGLLVAIVLHTTGFSQTVCGGQYYDNGGVAGDYLPNSDDIVVVCPWGPGHVVNVTFTMFDTEATYDGLYVYNGFSSSAPLIASPNPAGNVPGGLAGAYWGTNLPGPFTSTSPDGCLTFRFRSNGSNQRPGYIANVSCDVSPQGFQLNAFLDSNTNGTQEMGEINFPFGQFQYEKNTSGIVNSVYNNSGVGYILESNPANNYDISFLIDPLYSSNYTVSVPNYSSVNIGTSTGLVPINFPITAVVSGYDLVINVVNLVNVRPGFPYINRLYYTNYGNQTNGSLNFNNDTATPIVSTSIPVTTTATGFTYNFTNLLPFETRFLDVTMSVPSIPTVSLGQLVTNTATISTSVPELTLSNNTSSCSALIVGSYDPNDITESHGAQIEYANFAPNDELTYTIRFENTGTAAAQNVRITDVLDAKIDETSIKMVGASGTYVLERVSNNLTFKLDNIQLPVSVANTNIGKGFVSFKAKLKPGFVVGTTVPNAAKIYFDTNPAIDTNTFVTTFVSSLTTADFDFAAFNIVPNPTKNSINIVSNKEITIVSVQIINALGQLVLTSSNQTIDVSDLSAGTYFVKTTTDKGISNNKFVKL